MESFSSPYPLEETTSKNLRLLCIAIWDWKFCGSCADNEELYCADQTCSWSRAGKLGPFFKYYKRTVSSYIPEFIASGAVALRGHDDLVNVIQTIRRNLQESRHGITSQYFTNRQYGEEGLPDGQDQARAFNVGVKVLSMVNCSNENHQLDLLELGGASNAWNTGSSFSQFIAAAFPTTDHPTLNETQGSRGENILGKLNAEILQRNAGLKLLPTEDLSRHLKLDIHSGVVEIFHFTAFLKEHLIATKSSVITERSVV
jgi:hypothetical protein